MPTPNCDGCSGSCSEACNNNDWGSCSSCSDSCSSSCGECASCGDSCDSGCSGDCGGSNCQGDCDGGCNESCENSCSGGCSSTCTNSCKNNCTDNCNNGCSGEAQTAAYNALKNGLQILIKKDDFNNLKNLAQNEAQRRGVSYTNIPDIQAGTILTTEYINILYNTLYNTNQQAGLTSTFIKETIKPNRNNVNEYVKAARKLYEMCLSSKQQSTIKASVSSINLTEENPTTTFTYTLFGTNTVKVISSDNNIATATLSGNTVTVNKIGKGQCLIQLIAEDCFKYYSSSTTVDCTCEGILIQNPCVIFNNGTFYNGVSIKDFNFIYSTGATIYTPPTIKLTSSSLKISLPYMTFANHGANNIWLNILPDSIAWNKISGVKISYKNKQGLHNSILRHYTSLGNQLEYCIYQFDLEEDNAYNYDNSTRYPVYYKKKRYTLEYIDYGVYSDKSTNLGGFAWSIFSQYYAGKLVGSNYKDVEITRIELT